MIFITNCLSLIALFVHIYLIISCLCLYFATGFTLAETIFFRLKFH